MSGTGDLPEGYVLDETAPAAQPDDTFAPSGRRWEDLSLEEILQEVGVEEEPAPAIEAGPVQPDYIDWQQVFGGKLMAAAQATAGASGPRTFTVDDSAEFVADIIQRNTGRLLGARPTWVRFLREAEGKGALFALQAPHPLDGADLIVVANRGMITRGLLRDVAVWAFCAVQLNRLTVRIPEPARGLQDLARRIGFVFEGRNRDLYGPGAHGQTWAMTAADCPWLPHRARPARPITDVPFQSLKVH